MKYVLLLFLAISLQGFGQTTNQSQPIRKMIVTPDFSNMKSSEDCTIVLRLTIDPDGNVIEALNVLTRTTTTDKALIEDLQQRVLKEAKFEPTDQKGNTIVSRSFKFRNDDLNSPQPQPSLP